MGVMGVNGGLMGLMGCRDGAQRPLQGSQHLQRLRAGQAEGPLHKAGVPGGGGSKGEGLIKGVMGLFWGLEGGMGG